MNYPLNPTGTTMSQKHLKNLGKVAENNSVILLSDEIYGKIHHDGEHKSIVRYYPEGTIFSGGLSKWCGAGGWLFLFSPPLSDGSKMPWLPWARKHSLQLTGSDFGRDPEELTARLAYVDFDEEAALNSLISWPEKTPLGRDFLKIYCEKVLDGVERICDWMSK